jgi:hypothetical protein
MKKYMLTTVIAIVASSATYCQSIKQLEFLVGTWDLEEVVFPGTEREYIETGVRECAYYLDSAYIKCDSRAIRKGRDRGYSFLFNYVESENQFRLIKLWSDHSGYSIKSWKINADLQIIYEEDVTGEQFISDISIADKDQLVWRGWSPKNGLQPKLELIFREVATRR